MSNDTMAHGRLSSPRASTRTPVPRIPNRPWSKLYSSTFHELRDRLLELLIKHGIDPIIEHVGSTSVPRLAGKGVIDVLVGVKSGSEAQQCARLMKAAAQFVSTPSAGSRDRIFLSDLPLTSRSVAVHIHILPTRKREYQDMIAFRDALRSSKSLATSYAALKRRLTETPGMTPRTYQRQKAPFIIAAIRQQRSIRAHRRARSA